MGHLALILRAAAYSAPSDLSGLLVPKPRPGLESSSVGPCNVATSLPSFYGPWRTDRDQLHYDPAVRVFCGLLGLLRNGIPYPARSWPRCKSFDRKSLSHSPKSSRGQTHLRRFRFRSLSTLKLFFDIPCSYFAQHVSAGGTRYLAPLCHRCCQSGHHSNWNC